MKRKKIDIPFDKAVKAANRAFYVETDNDDGMHTLFMVTPCATWAVDQRDEATTAMDIEKTVFVMMMRGLDIPSDDEKTIKKMMAEHYSKPDSDYFKGKKDWVQYTREYLATIEKMEEKDEPKGANDYIMSFFKKGRDK